MIKKKTAWILKGLLFGLFMFSQEITAPIIRSELSLSELTTSVFAWVIGGLIFGFLLNQSESPGQKDVSY